MRQGAARRIAIVLSGFELSGAERQALLLADGLRRDHGREVLVAGFDPGGEVAERCAAIGVPTLRLPACGGRWAWLARWRARRSLAALRAFAPDALVPFTLWPNVACALGRAASGARAVLWNQRDEGIHTAYPHRRQVVTAIAAADALVANGPDGAAWLRRMGAAEARVSLVANGCRLPPPPPRAAAREGLGLPRDAPVAAMLAHESPRKDHATLLAAWALATPRLPRGALLVVAGRGAFAAARRQAGDLGIAASVRFAGAVADPSPLLAAADLLVHASLGEGMPNAVIEALLAGCPVVGSDLPSIRAALGPYAPGRLAPPCRPAALADAIVAALRDPPPREGLAEIAAWASGAYDPAAMVGRFAALIDRAVAA